MADAVVRSGVARRTRFGAARRCSSGVDLDACADGGFVSLLGPVGLRQVHAAARARRAAGARAAVGPWSTARPASAGPDSSAFMPQRDTLLPWRRALANATLGAEVAGVRHAGADGAAGSTGAGRARAVRALRPGRLRATAGRRSCRAACASGWRCCAPSWPAGTSLAARRAVRRARRPHPPGAAGLAGQVLAERAAHGAARHPRRRRGAAGCPTRCWCCRPGRPG